MATQTDHGVLVDVEVHPDVLLDPAALRRAALKKARLSESDVVEVRLRRKSIDARRGKVRIHARVELLTESSEDAQLLPATLPTMHGAPEVLIVGAGPTGLFCALALAQRGIRSMLLERGKAVRPRRRDLAALTRRGELNPESNYCFGEGGAGTFSDGKLYTRSNKRGDVEGVLRTLVGYGASPSIMIDARPHIGTNKLPGVITAMREHLASAGVELRFNSRVDGLVVKDATVTGVLVGDETLAAKHVVVAPGHSARDVFEWLGRAGAPLRSKPFAIGVRVEHAQDFIDQCQLGRFAGHPALGAASYRLVEQTSKGGVFSFCMCPGGFIAPAATEAGYQVVNGWSPSKRSGRFANSGFVAEVGESQLATFGLDPDDPFSGLVLQRRIEAAAFEAGGGDYGAPAQRIDDFVAHRLTKELPATSYPRPVVPGDLDAVLEHLAAPLRAALARVDRRMPGFAGPHAVAVGVESRTSSPIRIERDRTSLQTPGLARLYPAGEGAGYAGGIMSAALDGIRVANAIARQV